MGQTKNNLDIVAEKTVKQLLSRLAKEPVDIYPGYSDGMTLPPGTRVGLVATIDELKPLCTYYDESKLFVSFMVYKKEADMPIFEISLKTSGRYIYKNNQKFKNPPHFDELFNQVHTLYGQTLEKNKERNPCSIDVRIAHAQDIILDYFAKCGIIQR